MEFKINNRVRVKAGNDYEGAVGLVEEIDAKKGAALVTISGNVNEEPVSLTDWFFFDDLEIAA